MNHQKSWRSCIDDDCDVAVIISVHSIEMGASMMGTPDSAVEGTGITFGCSLCTYSWLFVLVSVWEGVTGLRAGGVGRLKVVHWVLENIRSPLNRIATQVYMIFPIHMR